MKIEATHTDRSYPVAMIRGAESVSARSLDEYGTFQTLGFAEASSYTHQEFPKALHKAGGESMSVKNEAELESALGKGWKTRPVNGR